MKVLSLFDGMSCGRLALNKAGISVSKYYASELDKFAIAESSANFPEHIHMGDVTKWREWDIDWSGIDLLLGGSPCQGFSAAGKQGGTKAELDGETFIVSTREQYLDLKSKGANFLSCSHLFWEYVLILDHIKSVNPNVKFLLENVKMKQEYLNMITDTLGVEPILINSALVSAQNRWRWYWCNWQTEQPEDKGILLKDIIEETPMSPTVMSDKFCKRNAHILRDDFNGKAKNLSAMEYVKNGRQGDYIAFAYNRKDGLKHEISKAYPLNASDWRGLNRNQTQNAVVYPAAIVGRRINPETGCRDDYNKAIPLVQTLEVGCGVKSRCLSTVQKDTLLSELPPGRYVDIYAVEIGKDNRCKGVTENSDGYRPHRGDKSKSGIAEVGRILKETAKKTNTLTTSHMPKLAIDYNKNISVLYRKLTVIECCRLQTVPDDYFKVSSNTQAYKMLGNGWTVDVIAHLFNCLVMQQSQVA